MSYCLDIGNLTNDAINVIMLPLILMHICITFTIQEQKRPNTKWQTHNAGIK